MRRSSSVALPGHVLLQEATDASRHAVCVFLAMAPDELSLSQWLAGPYREATCFGPRRARSQHPQPPPSLTPLMTAKDLVKNAKTVVFAALDAARHGIDELVSLLPPIVHVEPAHDALGKRGFIPIDGANMQLADRVLSLLVADCLSRPNDYLPNRHPLAGHDVPQPWLDAGTGSAAAT